MNTNNTKVMIEFLEDILESKRFVWADHEYTSFKKIITLLQYGKKSEKMVDNIWTMWVELRMNTDNYPLKKRMDKLEQKHLLKPKKNPIEEILENILWKAMKGFVENNLELILKCMKKAEKNEREKI